MENDRASTWGIADAVGAVDSKRKDRTKPIHDITGDGKKHSISFRPGEETRLARKFIYAKFFTSMDTDV